MQQKKSLHRNKTKTKAEKASRNSKEGRNFFIIASDVGGGEGKVLMLTSIKSFVELRAMLWSLDASPQMQFDTFISKRASRTGGGRKHWVTRFLSK